MRSHPPVGTNRPVGDKRMLCRAASMQPLERHRSTEGMTALEVSDREPWRAWLATHHASEAEVWLVYYKGAQAKDGIGYGESVEEALCFGWIDGLVRRIDDDCYMRRFTPRKPKSKWSASNKVRGWSVCWKRAGWRPEGRRSLMLLEPMDPGTRFPMPRDDGRCPTSSSGRSTRTTTLGPPSSLRAPPIASSM